MEYFDSWTLSDWRVLCHAFQMDDEVLGSILLYSYFTQYPYLEALHCKKCSFHGGDLDVVIEMGMPERTIDVSTLHGVVGSLLVEELRGFAVFLVHF